MFNVNLISLSVGEIKVGPSFTAIGRLGPPGGSESTPSGLPVLQVPWHTLQENPSVLALLSWHSRISDFSGHSRQLQELRHWSGSTPEKSIKFVTGPGGSGKSRLAAHFAAEVQGLGWSAGFVDLRRSRSFRMNKEGTLLVVDYPETQRSAVSELLKDLALMGAHLRIRVLLLTRQDPGDWEQTVTDSGAAPLLDLSAIRLQKVDSESAYNVFCTSQEKAANVFDTEPTPISAEALSAWLELAPLNQRPLFVVALAVHSALHPETQAVEFRGAEVVEALINAEMSRLRRVSNSLGIHSEAIERVLALAALSGGIGLTRVGGLIGRSDIGLAFEDEEQARLIAAASGFLTDNNVAAPEPDMLAAAFVLRVLSSSGTSACHLLWEGIQDDLAGGMERLARLGHDAETLGLRGDALGSWLAEAADSRQERCQLLEPYLAQDAPSAWLPACPVVWKTLLTGETDKHRRANLLAYLANHLRVFGDRPEALAAAQEAVDTARALDVKSRPEVLAMSLGSLGNSLSREGETEEALKIEYEAVELYRQLATPDPQSYEGSLALALNNCGCRLHDRNRFDEALVCHEQALEIRRRRCARSNTAGARNDLATSLTNRANTLSRLNRTKDALEAANAAVHLARDLAERDPARYEGLLALSLMNLSAHLKLDEPEEAVEVGTEAVELYRRTYEHHPARCGFHMAAALNNLSVALALTGRPKEALAPSVEAVEIWGKLVRSEQGYKEGLAASLGHLAARLVSVGRIDDALRATEEEVVVLELADRDPSCLRPRLAANLTLTLGTQRNGEPWRRSTQWLQLRAQRLTNRKLSSRFPR